MIASDKIEVLWGKTLSGVLAFGFAACPHGDGAHEILINKYIYFYPYLLALLL